MQTTWAKAALALAVIAAGLTPRGADAEDPAPAWFGGLREGVYPVLGVGVDEWRLPAGFTEAVGRKIYVIGPNGATATGVVKNISFATDNCMFATSLEGLPQRITKGLFLASVEPIQVAPARAIDPRDRRVTEGLARYLVAHGIPTPRIQVTQALEADLDGDGATEAIIAAQSAGEHSVDDGAPFGHFSLVALGTLTSQDFEVTTHFGYLTGVGDPGDTSSDGHFGLLALPDIDHDGRFEVALSDFGYEWTSILIYAWREKSLSLQASASCGS